MHLTEECANDVRGAAAGANLSGCGVEIALARVAERAAGWKIQCTSDPVRPSMAIFEHVGRDDEPPPRDEALRRGKSLSGQP